MLLKHYIFKLVIQFQTLKTHKSQIQNGYIDYFISLLLTI